MLARGLAVGAVVVGLGLTIWDYFGRYVRAEETAYLFESAATELAETANVYVAGDAARQVRLDRRLWDSFAPVRFLLRPDDRLRLYTEGVGGPVKEPALVLAWPYEDLRAATSALPLGAIIAPAWGPLHRGDLEPEPYALYAAYRVEACAPETCPPTALAEFEGGVRLLTAEVRPEDGGLLVELTWQAEAAPGREVQVAALAYGPDDALLGQADGPLGTELYPSAWWRAGEVVRETRRFVWSDDGSGAPVAVWIGLYDPVTGARYLRLDSNGEFVELAIRP